MSGSGVPCPNPETGARVAAVDAVARSEVSAGESQQGSGNDGSGQLRPDLYRALSPAAQELATLIDEALPAWQRQTEPQGREVTSLADFVAEWLIGFGYRRVVEDDTTVERIARALWGDFDGVVDGMTFDEASESTREAYRGRARAAVRAIREADGQ